jgi:hypothetical protein
MAELNCFVFAFPPTSSLDLRSCLQLAKLYTMLSVSSARLLLLWPLSLCNLRSKYKSYFK